MLKMAESRDFNSCVIAYGDKTTQVRRQHLIYLTTIGIGNVVAVEPKAKSNL